MGSNTDTGEAVAVVLTKNNIRDDAVVAELLAQVEERLLSCAGDGAYDKRKVYDTLHEHSPAAKALIPPRKDAHIWQHVTVPNLVNLKQGATNQIKRAKWLAD